MFFRKEFQGIESPVERTEENFDPGAKSHVADYTPYNRYNIIKIQHIWICTNTNLINSLNVLIFRYFIGHFLQYQFYEALCDLANQTKPLHKCDFYGSKVAGSKLKYFFSFELIKSLI